MIWKRAIFTFYRKHAFRTEGISMTCCVKGLQLLRKQIKSIFKPVYKNIIELKKY